MSVPPPAHPSTPPASAPLSSPLPRSDRSPDHLAPPGAQRRSEPVGVPAEPGVFELHPSGADAWSWRLRDQHGDEVAIGKLYESRDECRAAISVTLAALGVGGEHARVVEVDA